MSIKGSIECTFNFYQEKPTQFMHSRFESKHYYAVLCLNPKVSKPVKKQNKKQQQFFRQSRLLVY